ncbi:MAG: serine/threonine-protein phosphatase [Myxococcales bacterium]|nr:serine/threonine-protein phosphatase [Myxococcales bacterium]
MASDPSIHLHVAGKTDVGLVRDHNEDTFMVVDLGRRERESAFGMRTIEVGPEGALLLVCDGMGGAAAGEVASAMAADLVFESMNEAPPPGANDQRLADFARRMRSAALTANEKIHAASRSNHAHAGMGTTMTGVGVIANHLVMAQVGDSRAYVLRDGVIVQVTRDQSLVNQLLESGQITEEQAKLFEHSNVILQALGVQPDVEVQLSRVELRRGDRVVVCSDGLTGVISDEELAAIVGSSDDSAEACRLLVEMARAGGGPDNITVIVGRCESDSLPASDPEQGIKYQRWRLDEPEPAPEGAPGPTQSDVEAVEPARARPVDSAQVFFSSMVLLALALAAVVLSSLLYRSSPRVACIVSAATAGLSIRVDGRDVGARTRAGETPIKLPPGRHRIGLRGAGAPPQELTVEAGGAGADTSGSACSARFGRGRAE